MTLSPSGIGGESGLTKPAADGPLVFYKVLRKAQSQHTNVRQRHTSQGDTAVSVEQDIEWGRVSQKSAVVKTLSFKYFIHTEGRGIEGGLLKVYGGSGDGFSYHQSRSDWLKGYHRVRSDGYAGTYTVRLNRYFYGGQLDGSVSVVVEKYIGLGALIGGDDFALSFPVVYYRP